MKTIIYAHLATILPVVAMGPYILLRKKGDQTHKRLGKIWVALMIVSCLLSFGIRGPDGRLNWLHGLAAFTIYSVIDAVRKIRKGDLMAHRHGMIGPYIGVVIAMFFAFYAEHRLLGSWLRSLFF